MEEKKCSWGGGLRNLGRRELRLGANTMFIGPAWLNTETLEVDMAVCDRCHEVKLFLPEGKFEKLTDSREDKYRRAFADYSEEDLRRIMENGNYLPEVRRATRALLEKRT